MALEIFFQGSDHLLIRVEEDGPWVCVPMIAAAAAIPELLEAGGAAEGAGAGAEAGGGLGGLGGMLKDFNDNPISQIGGQMGGKLMHAITGAIGTGGGDRERANIGPIGTIA
jgi:hypothetical protein